MLPCSPLSESDQEQKIREKLWKTEAQLAFALEVAGGVGTWDWDLKSDLIYCNERFATLFSVDPAVAATRGVPSSDYIAAIHREDQHIVVERTQQAVATAGPYVVEFRLPQKNAPDFWIYALGHAYRDAEGTPSRFPGAAMDITQRKLMETELKIARDRAQSILESITDGFFTLDHNFCFSHMNQAGEEILDAKRADVVGKSLWELYPETVGTQVEDEYRRAVRDQAPASFEWLFVAWRRWFAIKAYPTHEGGLSVYFRDISEQKKTETLERERLEQLRESTRLESLGLMAGGIAHDFNNLLTGILGYASLLTECVGDEEAAFANEIVIAGQRAASLTRQMLDYSGHGVYSVLNFDLNAHIRENLTLLLASLSANVGIGLELGAADYVIDADRAQIQQVVMNLLVNAAEAVADGPGRVTIRTELIEHRPARFSPHLRATVPAGKYVALELRDNGAGMTSETVKKIFDPFFTTKFTGRGLGLAAVLGIVRGHGGDIEVISEQGVGSSFRISPAGVTTHRAAPARSFGAVVAARGKSNRPDRG
jgi:PAS domain S-box-containing protein